MKQDMKQADFMCKIEILKMSNSAFKEVIGELEIYTDVEMKPKNICVAACASLSVRGNKTMFESPEHSLSTINLVTMSSNELFSKSKF